MPYNPLERFIVSMIPFYLDMKHPFLVTQSYPRGNNLLAEKPLTSILLCDYASEGSAKAHLGGIKSDKWAAIIDLEKEAHRNKLIDMARPDSAYLLYVAFVSDIKKTDLRSHPSLTKAIRCYISTQTDWQPTRNDTIKPNLELIFGELFVRLSYKGQVIKERLEVVEQIQSACVTTSPLPPASGSFPIIFQDSSLIRS